MAMAERYKSGDGVFQSDTKSLEMRICAAELGYAEALRYIGTFYRFGITVQQNPIRALRFYTVAAKKGSILGHQELAEFRRGTGETQAFIRHHKVAACVGDQVSMDSLMKAYRDELLTKEELTQTLRAFQTSSNGARSKERDDACAHLQELGL